MKPRCLFLLGLFVIVLGMVVFVRDTTLAVTPTNQEPPLRMSEPTNVIIADLESYIPDYMQEMNIPGVAIALIRDHEIVWTEGFGVVNAITRKTVTPDTAFEVASLVIVGLLGLLILRIRTGKWRPTRWMVFGVSLVAFILSLLPAFILLGDMDWLEFAWLISLFGIILALTFALAFFVVRGIILRLASELSGKLTALTIVLSVIIVTILAGSQAKTNLPVPK